MFLLLLISGRLFSEENKDTRPKYLAAVGGCSTMRQDVTHVGENRGSRSGPSLACGCSKVTEAGVLADVGGRRRACLGRMPGLWRDSLSRGSQRGRCWIQVHLSEQKVP